MITVAIIIPYYQKTKGVLRRALNSVQKQNLPQDTEVKIIIIDDGSPVPAKEEIDGLTFSGPLSLKLIDQQNGGVAAARNTGLKNIGGETTFIAFLDSDDIWNPDHLQTALSALNSGYDFYFSDHQRLGGHNSFFKMWRFSPVLLPHPKGGNIYEINKDELTDAVLKFAISHMSTTVLRWNNAHNERFNSVFCLAGEDVTYLLQVALKCDRFCYSTDIKVTCADGVNIWASRYDWDAPLHMASQLCRLISMQQIRDSLPLTTQSLSFATKIIKQLRRYFAFMTIREFIKRGRFWPASVEKMRQNDRTFWRWYLVNVLYVTICYPLYLYKPKD